MYIPSTSHSVRKDLAAVQLVWTIPPASPEGCHTTCDLEAWDQWATAIRAMAVLGACAVLPGGASLLTFSEFTADQQVPKHSRTSACQCCLCNEFRILESDLHIFFLLVPRVPPRSR